MSTSVASQIYLVKKKKGKNPTHQRPQTSDKSDTSIN